MLDRVKFSEGMALLCEVYQREPNDILLKAYYAVLETLTDNEFESACMNLLKTKTFNKLPLPSEILEAINGKVQDQAALALAKVEKAIRQVGGYKTVAFDDPLIHVVLNCFDGGWVGICDMSIDEWTWARKDFIRLYEANARNTQRGQIPDTLAGRFELQNGNSGESNRYAPIVYIGGKQNCLAWREQQQLSSSDTKLEISHIGGLG